jgi:predicted nucleotidyltransferase
MKITMTIREWKQLMKDENRIMRQYFEVGAKNGEYVALSQKGEVFAYDLKRKTYVYYPLNESSEIVTFDVEALELRDDLTRANLFKEIEKIIDTSKCLKYL